jgi:hypothetical protein
MKRAFFLLLLLAGFMTVSCKSACAVEVFVNTPKVSVTTTDSTASVTVSGFGSDATQEDAEIDALLKEAAESEEAEAERPMSNVNFYNADLSDTSYVGQALAGKDFSNALLMRADFRGADLTGAKFRGADLTDANFSGATMSGADLSNATLFQANLTHADLARANLANARLDGAFLNGTILEGATLTNVDMSLAIRGVASPAHAGPSRMSLPEDNPFVAPSKPEKK